MNNVDSEVQTKPWFCQIPFTDQIVHAPKEVGRTFLMSRSDVLNCYFYDQNIRLEDINPEAKIWMESNVVSKGWSLQSWDRSGVWLKVDKIIGPTKQS